eukprot:436098-Rhodomonas_salina.1
MFCSEQCQSNCVAWLTRPPPCSACACTALLLRHCEALGSAPAAAAAQCRRTRACYDLRRPDHSP